jgi:REP element-mobilizing transposase RayT
MSEPELIIKQRDLPHWELPGSVYFVTFKTWEKLELTPAARQIVLDSCKFFHNQRYRIFVLVVMPDHVHLLIEPLPKLEPEFWSLGSIMHSIKSYSAKQIPKVMRHVVRVWQPERYDHIIRNQRELWNVWGYIRQNPVKAGLSDTPEECAFFWEPTAMEELEEITFPVVQPGRDVQPGRLSHRKETR